MAANTIVLTCDAKPLCQALELLIQFFDRARQVGGAFLGRAQQIAQALRIDPDGLAAAHTVQGCIVLQPSERLLELMAAARAIERDFGVVEIEHGGPRREA